MAFPIAEILLVLIAAIVFGFVGVGFGYFLSPFHRAKFMRSQMKKDMGVIKILGKDGHRFITHIVDLDNSSIEIDDKIWFFKKGFVYTDKHPETGFNFHAKKASTEDGLPTVYLDSTSLKPITFTIPTTQQTPQEMSAWLRTNSRIQVAKGLVGNKTQQQIAMATLAVSIVIILGLVVIWMAISEVDAKTTNCMNGVNDVKNIIQVVDGVSVQNGTVIVSNPGLK